MSIGLAAVILIFSVPLLKVVSSHLEKTKEIKRDIIRDQLELERLKNENFKLETEKLRLELEQSTKNILL
ncbi:hypothetical protein [Bacillus sp. 1P06AnD]|uniref:hypothetical protein n=1 Tax=Bacillus sp. 1P06AnD TaxID=3132208 RepID=UPI0039A2C510